MSQLMEQVEKLKKRIMDFGVKVGDVIEATNTSIHLNSVNYEEEEKEVINYFDEEEMDFEKKLKEEAPHYGYLKYGLLSKINYNKFYHGEDPVGSRKLYVHSEDCISTIHILARKTLLIANVYIRSSEVKCLLPIDCLGIINIVDTMESSIYNFMEMPFCTDIIIFIGSAHLYIKGERTKDAALHTRLH